MRARQDDGFSLVEAIVALAILALSIQALVSLVSDASGPAAKAKHIQMAAFLAESTLASLGHDLPLREGESRGSYANGFAWELRIAPRRSAPDNPELSIRAYDVSLAVRWGADAAHSFVLETVRLGGSPAQDVGALR